MSPLWDHTGVPGLVAFAHFHSSTTSGSAALMIPRTLLSVLPRQSPSSVILLSISSEAFVLVFAIWISSLCERTGDDGEAARPGRVVRAAPDLAAERSRLLRGADNGGLDLEPR